MSQLFELGKVLLTRGVASEIEADDVFGYHVAASLHNYKLGKWGETCKADKAMNDSAVKNGDDRIVAKYSTNRGDIFIITEWDRSATTIMFTGEY